MAEPRALRIDRDGSLRRFGEAPVLQGAAWGPRERLVGGVILGPEGELLRVLKEAGLVLWTGPRVGLVPRPTLG